MGSLNCDTWVSAVGEGFILRTEKERERDFVKSRERERKRKRRERERDFVKSS